MFFQGIEVEMLLFITFYLKYAVVLVELLLHLWADQRAMPASRYKHAAYTELVANDENVQNVSIAQRF